MQCASTQNIENNVREMDECGEVYDRFPTKMISLLFEALDSETSEMCFASIRAHVEQKLLFSNQIWETLFS